MKAVGWRTKDEQRAASLGTRLPAKLRHMNALRALLLPVLWLVSAGGLVAQETVRRDSTVTPAPIVMRRDFAVLGAGAGLAFLAQRVDLRVRNEVRSAGWQENGALRAIEPVGDLWGGAVAVGAGFALWGGGVYARNATVAATGFRAIEAITVSGQITALLKGAIGRARPRVDSTDAWNVEFGRGFRGTDGDYKSMPSGHTSRIGYRPNTSKHCRREICSSGVMVGWWTVIRTTARIGVPLLVLDVMQRALLPLQALREPT